MPGQEPTPGRPPVDLEALTDLCTPWCILVVATLRIADHVAAGTSDIDQLAGATGCDTRALHNVLGHLVAKGVFEETAPGRFALNDAALQLREASDFLDLEGIGGRMAHAWSTLPTYVRTGAPGYAEVFGLPFWEVLPAHPGIRGTLVDFPGTVARSSEVFDAAGVADRVTTVGQSFLDPLPAGADLYLLRKVLNDWPDRETTAILRRCGEAARPSGRVLVLGGVSALDAPRHLAIEMLLVGGRNNTLAEFRGLARQAGLEVSAAERQPSG